MRSAYSFAYKRSQHIDLWEWLLVGVVRMNAPLMSNQWDVRELFPQHKSTWWQRCYCGRRRRACNFRKFKGGRISHVYWNRTRAQQRLCLVLVVTCYKLKRSKLTRRRLPTWNGFGPFSTQRTTTTLLCTKAWQSKRLRSAKNMKMVRNGWLLLGPQSLNGMALVQLHMVFSDDESFLTRFCWKRSCKSTRYAIYSTHRRFCCHHM